MVLYKMENNAASNGKPEVLSGGSGDNGRNSGRETISFRDLDVMTASGQKLVEAASGGFRAAAMNAVIGPSGCGKTTLVKGILGLAPRTSGKIFLDGRRMLSRDELIGVAGFAPQFSIAHRKLTVGECLGYSLDLLVSDGDEKRRRYSSILQLVGLEALASVLVENLSGGQLRRLGLAMELATNPQCLFCDEVTSGLDPQSEEQILGLLERLTREQGKTLICVIHNLSQLSFFQHVTVLYRSRLVFQGSLPELLAYFGIADIHLLYDRLDEEQLDFWVQRWGETVSAKSLPGGSRQSDSCVNSPRAEEELSRSGPLPIDRPGAFSQFKCMIRRRLRLFARDRGYLGLTLGITFGFPVLVVIFAAGGLPQIESMPLEHTFSLESFRAMVELEVKTTQTGALVSGLVMFQVILLTLMGSNNGAREIAGERQVYEKERLSGLRPGSYIAGKAAFVSMIAVAQGVWMTFFVKTICGFPGAWGGQMLVLAGATVAMSLISLGFSALFNSPERASLLSIYLVGFQLPLSGVVLALPEALIWLVRPFITAYWSWAGYLATMKETRYYDAVVAFSDNWVAPTGIAVTVIALQCIAGLWMVFSGCQRRYWE